MALRRYRPMKAVSGSLPVDEGWAYELKWDGMRAIAANTDRGVVAHSSRLNDITPRFPELAGLGDLFGGMEVVVDGELVALGEDGLPSFGRLQGRMHLTRAHDIARRSLEIPVVYVIFDVLVVDGSETLSLPYDDRRTLLESLVEPGPTWQLASVHHTGPRELLRAVTERGIEGLVAKRRSSTYQEGRRSADWVKVKPRRRQELVVGGWLSGEAGRSERIGALLVGYHDGAGALCFAGRVGSGLTEAEVTALLGVLRDRPENRSPFAGPVPAVRGRQIHFVEPEVVVEVAFAEWTAEGILRHPVYMGRRADADPTSVVREPDPAP